MARHPLPQLDGGLFLTDAGLETDLIFHHGAALPLFAAFPLLGEADGTALLHDYYAQFAELARARGTGLVLETPTWRASARWASELGYSAEQLADHNRRAVALLKAIRDELGVPLVISGNLGPQDDGYSPATILTAEDAERYHADQIATFAATDADLVTALTLTYADEAIGIARAATAAGIPVVISFTVETDGRLPSGQGLGDAIVEVDTATDGAPAYYMVNCAHPTHFAGAITGDEPWVGRIRGLRANASTCSHAELDAATELDEGDPADLAARYVALRAKLPRLTVLGGCCGTDLRHVEHIADAWLAATGARA